MTKLSDYDPAVKYGADLDVNVDLGDIRDANNNEMLELDAVSSAVNYIRVANAATGSGPTFSAQGDDTNVAFNLTSKGTGAVTIYSGDSSRELMVLNDATSAVNYLDATPAATGSNPAFAAAGDDTNISLQLTSKGSGLVIVGDKGTAVIVSGSATINAQRGQLHVKALSITVNGTETVTLLNNRITTDSDIQFTLSQPATNGITAGIPIIGSYEVESAGSCVITIANTAATAVAGTAIINFALLS